jgi:hypothetical protein
MCAPLFIGQEIIEIGRELTEAKEKCKHGEWLPFLEKEVDFSERSASDYMKIYKEFGNSHHGAGLGKRALLFLTTLTDEQKEQAEQITGKMKVCQCAHLFLYAFFYRSNQIKKSRIKQGENGNYFAREPVKTKKTKSLVRQQRTIFIANYAFLIPFQCLLGLLYGLL